MKRRAFLFGAPLVFLLGLGLDYIRVMPASGDEVEYLLLAQSLWREHDLDLRDNFARGDHLEYIPGLESMPYGTWRADGRPISTHSVGLPLLLAPLYALGGRVTCAVFMALCAAGLGVLVYRFAANLTDDAEASLVAWLLAVGPPVFFYGFHAYTEVPSALLAIVAFIALLRAPTIGLSLLAGLAVAVLPWLHVKMIPAAAVLAVMGFLRLRGTCRALFAAIVLLSAASYGIHHYRVFGDPTPLSLYGSKIPRKIQRSSPWLSLPGIFLDGAFGLLPLAPGFLLGLSGLPALWRRLGPDRAWGAALILSILLPLLFWRTWWGGFCPPARFLVPLVPFLAVAAACRVADGRGGLARWRWGLVAWGSALALFMSARPQRLLFLPDRAGPAPVFEALRVGVSLNDALPRLTPGAMTPFRAVAWVAGVVFLVLWDARSNRSLGPKL